MNYWLMKTEPDAFSLDDLKNMPKQTTMWDGVRNYQARNLLRDDIKVGDKVFFYHSRVKPPCIVATTIVTRNGYPDPTQFDTQTKYYDSKSSEDNPRWYCVDITFEKELNRPIGLDELRLHPKLEGMKLLQKGARLSVQPVTKEEWTYILSI